MGLVKISWLLLPVLVLYQSSQTHAQSYKLVRIRSRGFLPRDIDVLPFAVVKRVYDQQMQQQRTGKQLRPVLVRGTISSHRRPTLYAPQRQVRELRPLPSGYLGGSMWNQLTTGPLRLERSKHDSKHFRIYDPEDGERLLELRFHNGFDKFDTTTTSSKRRSANKWKDRWPTLTTATTITTTTAEAEVPTTTTLLDTNDSGPTPTKRQKLVQHLFLPLR